MSFSSFKTAIILYLIQCGKKLIHKQPLLATIAQHKQPLLATIAQHKQPLLATITQHNWATIKSKITKKKLNKITQHKQPLLATITH
jgi:nucleoside-triphosphatase THEP1